MATATFQSVFRTSYRFEFRGRCNICWAACSVSRRSQRVYDDAAVDGRAPLDRGPAARLSCGLLHYVRRRSCAHPQDRPAIVTVNHPFGILEGAVLSSLLAQVRPDVRFLANGFSPRSPSCANGDSGRPDLRAQSSRRQQQWTSGFLKHLRTGGMLVIFPAGEVSHFRWKDRAVTDAEWNPAVARIAGIARVYRRPRLCGRRKQHAVSDRRHGACQLPYGAARPRAAEQAGTSVEVRIGAPIAAEKLMAIPTPREQADYLRWRTYLLASRERFKPSTALPLPARRKPSAATDRRTGARRALAAEIAGAARRLPAEPVERPGGIHRAGEAKFRTSCAS